MESETTKAINEEVAIAATTSLTLAPLVVSVGTGIGIGAALMYFLDPRLGPYRRGIARDKTTSLATRSVVLAEKKGRNVRNHLRGIVAEARKLLRGEAAVSDRALADRIRSKLGRVLLHPNLLEIEVVNGCVVASGKLDRSSAQRALSTIRRIRGVDMLEDRVERLSEQGVWPES